MMLGMPRIIDTAVPTGNSTRITMKIGLTTYIPSLPASSRSGCLQFQPRKRSNAALERAGRKYGEQGGNHEQTSREHGGARREQVDGMSFSARAK